MKTKLAARLMVSLMTAATVLLVGGRSEAQDPESEAERPRLGKVVVFPFEAVNVDHGTARAFTGIFESALRARGITVLDWRPVYQELFRETAPEAAPAPAPAPPPAAVAPTMFHHYPPAAMSSSSVVTHATPPPHPGSAMPEPPQQQYYAAPQVVYIQQPPPPQPYVQPVHPPHPLISASAMKGIASRAGADAYIEGSLTRLGNQIRVLVVVRDVDGIEINNQVMDARTDADLSNVLERIATALARGKSTAETLDLDNATMYETQKLPERFKLETNLGAILGQAFSLNDDMNHLTLIAFDARFEINDLLVELNAGLFFSAGKSDFDSDSGLLAGISVAYYLSHSPISPYLGAGAGIFIGDMLSSKSVTNSGLPRSDDDSSSIGFHASPMLGVEFLRHTRIRVHVDFRWMLVFDPAGRFGHGPMPLIGINF